MLDPLPISFHWWHAHRAVEVIQCHTKWAKYHLQTTMSVDHLNYLLLEEVFSGESFCWFSQSVSCVVAKSLNGDLYSCARGMILQTENSLLHSLSRPDLLFVIFNSVMTVLNDVTTKYRLMREEAAYANHNVVVWYLLECRCSLLDERSVLTTPSGLRVTLQSKTWRTATMPSISSLPNAVCFIRLCVTPNWLRFTLVTYEWACLVPSWHSNCTSVFSQRMRRQRSYVICFVRHLQSASFSHWWPF